MEPTLNANPRPAPLQPRSLLVTALFRDREHAERAYRALQARGYSGADVNVMMSDGTRRQLLDTTQDGAQTRIHEGGLLPVVTEQGNKAAKGAGVGSAIGGTVGAIAAAIAAVGTSLAIPGLGLVVAGPIAAALAGAGAGGATGGLLGALVGAGIPEERVKHYEEGVRRGGILMGVQARSPADAELLEREWRQGGADHVYR
ncbi:MAG: hypothetical protein MUF07_12190 [Steroidobacteraceae bacterium]|jgi:hypothetical protein|nr:hypothetical protein [Steroidobacteraceae bacterium]